MVMYSPRAVDKAIAASNRSGRHIGAREAKAIHRLLAGRTAPDPDMTKERLIAGLAALGYNISTANRLLGIGRSTLYRMSKGTAAVPMVVAKLLDMYERHGIPEEHR